jgi:nucleotide-binding universal stress UspA family protein
VGIQRQETDDVGYATILHPNDGSPAAALATPHAIEVARLSGARLIGIYVSDEHLLFSAGIHRGEAAHETSAEAKQVLDTMAVAAALAGVPFTGRFAVGRPGEVIMELAESEHADLIVIGSHGGGALEHLLVGSAAEAMIRQAKVPVMVVPWRSRPGA